MQSLRSSLRLSVGMTLKEVVSRQLLVVSKSGPLARSGLVMTNPGDGRGERGPSTSRPSVAVLRMTHVSDLPSQCA
jgi:hypothetical protein